MTWALAAMLALALWWLFDIRRALRLRAVPRIGRTQKPTSQSLFGGAVPPNRFVVVKWPTGQLAYQGCIGARAREVYEHTHPGAPGESVEFWELGSRRGIKEG